jgi:hypothetical protein
MATDLMDPDLKSLRSMRWTKAFGTTTTAMNSISESDQTPSSSGSAEKDTHRKATIVLETLIQASDVTYSRRAYQVGS